MGGELKIRENSEMFYKAVEEMVNEERRRRKNGQKEIEKRMENLEETLKKGNEGWRDEENKQRLEKEILEMFEDFDSSKIEHEDMVRGVSGLEMLAGLGEEERKMIVDRALFRMEKKGEIEIRIEKDSTGYFIERATIIRKSKAPK